ncbi:MAG: dihydropteroate synthase [Prevotella sp.]|jgi:dihydropteroate synthase|nr:dihydropteroate synthase [Prevotella sp.]
MKNYTINAGGTLLSLEKPLVMGILNATPDSFFEGSRMQTEAQIADRANQIMEEGGTIIDVGAFSTRPGAAVVSEEEELKRMRRALAIVRREQPKAVVSIDTYRPSVARMAVEEYGADIINDVSEGGLTGVVDTPLDESEDKTIFETVAALRVPYILMSVKSNVHDMLKAFASEVAQLRALGVNDIILDPGFGFGKTLDENYALLSDMEKLQVMDLPLLVGVSRKRMIWQLSGTSAGEALNGTTAINMVALMKGAHILRVHDVKEAREAVDIFNKMNDYAV